MYLCIIRVTLHVLKVIFNHLLTGANLKIGGSGHLHQKTRDIKIYSRMFQSL